MLVDKLQQLLDILASYLPQHQERSRSCTAKSATLPDSVLASRHSVFVDSETKNTNAVPTSDDNEERIFSVFLLASSK